MTRPTKTPDWELKPRQEKFDFVRPDRWRGLPDADQEACRRALAALLRQVVSRQTETETHYESDDYEREDTNRTP
jgi:hypothetical protein